MSNVFNDVLNDVSAVKDNLLGPSYPYYKNIKTPAELGMGNKPTMAQLGTDIQGLISYTNLLVSGKSVKGLPNASATGGPLGNRFFMKTGAKCLACTDKASCDNCQKNPSDCQQTDRFIFIDNVPNGNIPFISSGLGTNFSEFKGLIPGAMGNLNALNPFGILSAFTSGSTPSCMQISMEKISNTNDKSMESNYVTLADISAMDPCSFPDKKNIYNGKQCKESFQPSSIEPSPIEVSVSPQLPGDGLDQIYFLCLTFIGFFILFRLMEKN